MQEFGWTGTLQSDLLVYPDILEECRSEESMEESVREQCRGLESVSLRPTCDVGIDKGSKDPCEM